MAAEVKLVGPDYAVTTADTTNTLMLGTTSIDDTAGAYVIQFVKGAAYSGSITVVGRMRGQIAQAVPVQALPYRKLNVADTVADGSIVTVALTDSFIILVPANALHIGLTMTVAAGVGHLYFYPVTGGFTP